MPFSFNLIKCSVRCISVYFNVFINLVNIELENFENKTYIFSDLKFCHVFLVTSLTLKFFSVQVKIMKSDR